MKSKKIEDTNTYKEFYSDAEINELASWYEDLTLRQAFFLKDQYEHLLNHHALEAGSNYVQ